MQAAAHSECSCTLHAAYTEHTLPGVSDLDCFGQSEVLLQPILEVIKLIISAFFATYSHSVFIMLHISELFWQWRIMMGAKKTMWIKILLSCLYQIMPSSDTLKGRGVGCVQVKHKMASIMLLSTVNLASKKKMIIIISWNLCSYTSSAGFYHRATTRTQSLKSNGAHNHESKK